MSEVGIMNIRNTALQIREQLDSLIADINTIQTQRQSPTKWCLAHKPEKPYHEEEYEQISKGNYHMFPHPTTPEDTINSISVGDEVYMRIRTCIGASGQTLSKPKYKSYYRKGVVITRPTETNPDFDPNRIWYVMDIDWSDTPISHNTCDYKNTPFKTITKL